MHLGIYENVLIGIVLMLFGVVLGVLGTIKASRPKLVFGGIGGTSSNANTFCVVNRTSFLGWTHTGESARELTAFLRPQKRGAQGYIVYWQPHGTQSETIDPGKQACVALFYGFKGEKGYMILDGQGNHVARYTDQELTWELTLRDSLGRKTIFLFTVVYDDSQLDDYPHYNILFPVSIKDRWDRVLKGLRIARTAFRKD